MSDLDKLAQRWEFPLTVEWSSTVNADAEDDSNEDNGIEWNINALADAGFAMRDELLSALEQAEANNQTYIENATFWREKAHTAEAENRRLEWMLAMAVAMYVRYGAENATVDSFMADLEQRWTARLTEKEVTDG